MTKEKGRKGGNAPDRGGKRRDWLPSAEWGLAALLTGTALFLHFTFFTHAGALWRDEVNSVEFASMPSLSSTYESLRYDSFPLLSTLLLRGWVHMGLESDQGLRVFGFLVGVLLLGTLWLTCRLLGCPVPLVSMALVGLNPWVVRTADSIRPYGLGTVLIVATLGCVWKAVESSKPKWFLFAGLFAVLSVQCMYQNAFLLLAICLAAAIVSLRGSRIKAAVGAVLVGLVAALSLVLYLPSIAAAQSWGVLVRAPIPARQLLEVLGQALGSGSVVIVWLWFGLAILSVWMGVRALISRRRQPAARARSDLTLFCATVLVAAGAMYWMALKAAQLFVQPWYYVPLAVMVAPTLEATAWLTATTARWRLARLAVVLAIACAMVVPAWRPVREHWTNVDVLAAKIGKAATAEDTIVLYPFWIGITFQRYYRGPARLVTIPPMEDVHIVRFDLVKAAMASPGQIEPALEVMARTLQSGHRVFWVGGLPIVPGDEPQRPLPAAPLSGSGWYIAPYMSAWGRQASNFLETHGLRADAMEGPRSSRENVAVTVVSGWR